MSVLEAVARQRVVVLAVVLGLWSPAWADGPWRAVARVVSAEDRALLERVRGQSSDLPVVLEVEAGRSMDSGPGGAWREAERLASRRDARAVLWFTRDGAALRVSVAAPKTGHLFVRSARVEGAPETLTWSVGAEALALAVRSALRAVDAGEPLGEVVAPPPPPPVVTPPPPPPPAVASPVAEAPGAKAPVAKSPVAKAQVAEAPAAKSQVAEAPVAKSQVAEAPAAKSRGAEAPVAEVPVAEAQVAKAPADGAFVQVGVHAALDGYHAWGQQGLSVGAGWAGRELRLRAQVLAALPVHLRDAYADIRLTQGAVLAWADVPFVKAGAWEGTVGLGAGVAGFWRRTEARAAEVEPTPSRMLAAFVVGSAVRVAWRVAPALALEAALSGEVLLGRPRLGYSVDGEFVLREDGASVRPRLGVGMVIFP
ncbi:hypothetical protein [Corallococcus sp. AS-1-6]|uniref:hypothetical protein n=1 Tax=Corallococcus sp. AS-1-6 TaxID=2874599 RepID=UPI001CBBD6BE|nr:hypothetical protein [Corallococcus sp. AS-1-6]MBZ4376520.1 hypothetical protein [Corallococcus sp. AS-1-6]